MSFTSHSGVHPIRLVGGERPVSSTKPKTDERACAISFYSVHFSQARINGEREREKNEFSLCRFYAAEYVIHFAINLYVRIIIMNEYVSRKAIVVCQENSTHCWRTLGESFRYVFIGAPIIFNILGPNSYQLVSAVQGSRMHACTRGLRNEIQRIECEVFSINQDHSRQPTDKISWKH